MKLLNIISVGILAVSAQLATADDSDTVAECNVDGKVIQLQVRQGCGVFLDARADLGDGIKAIARIRPGYGMLFHDLSLVEYSESIIAHTTAYLPDRVGAPGSADEIYDRVANLSLTANPRNHNIICDYHIAAALKLLGR